ncbi:MAG: ATP-grasp domain-containing protein [Pseudonocardiaceae bacterium]
MLGGRGEGVLAPADRRFAEAEAHHGVGGLLSCLPCRWVSHPARIADASAKPGQLRLAAACGLSVPETLVSSSPEQVREFVAVGGPVVYKPMSPGALWTSDAPRAVYATLLDPAMVEEWLDAGAVGVTANQFQRYIADKDADLRVTAVGERLFSVAIRARTQAARVDWRRGYGSLDYEVVARYRGRGRRATLLPHRYWSGVRRV